MTNLNFLSNATAIMAAVLLLAGCSREAQTSRHLSRGERYFEAHEYQKAKIEYANVLQLDPDNPIALKQLGLIWSEQGSPLRALPFLLRTRQLLPNHTNARLRLASAVAAQGRIGEARKEILAVLQESPNDPEALLMLAETARQPEEISDAHARLESALEKNSVTYQLAAAVLAQRQGKVDDVVAALRRALAIDPKSALAHLALADLYDARGQTDEASNEYKLASEFSPPRAVAHLRYAQFLLRLGRTTEADAVLKPVTRAVPDYLPAWNLRARVAVEEKRYNEAIAALEHVLRDDPMNFDAQLVQAEALIGKDEVAEAITALEKLTGVYENVPAVKYQLARAYLRGNRPRDAITALNDALKINPEYAEASLLLGEAHLRNNDPRSVVGPMLAFLKKHPRSSSARLLLAQAERAQGRMDEAVAVLREENPFAPSAPEHMLLGMILRQQNKPLEARQAFEEALAVDPQNLLATFHLAELDVLEGNIAAAQERADQLIEKRPDMAGAYFVRGRVLSAREDWDGAKAALNKALELDPDFTGAYELLSAVYINAGRLPQAIAQLNDLLARDPDNRRALMLSGVIYTELGEPEKARTAYEKLLAGTADFAPALNNLAWLLGEKFNELDKAYELARKARSLRPDDGAVADTLGWIHYQRGEYQRALGLLREAARSQPNNFEIQFHLGLASNMMGETESARVALEKAAQAPQEFAGKESIAERLALLGKAADGTPALSIDELQKVLQAHPNDTTARAQLAKAFEQRGEVKQAAEALEKVLEVNPRMLVAAVELAELYAGPLHDPAKAFEFAKTARELSPNDPNVMALFGRTVLQKGNAPWAYSLLSEAATRRSDDAALRSQLAWAAYHLGKMEEARREMKRVAETSQNEELAEEAKRFLHFTTAPADSGGPAKEEIDQALQKTPDYLPALMARAALKEKQNSADQAIATYQEILRQSPTFAPAMKELAALQMHDPATREAAFEWATKARKILPNDRELAHTMAELDYQRGDYAEAIRVLEAAARQQPLAASELFLMGMAHWRLNESGATQEALKRALAEGLGEPSLSEAKKVLAELAAR